MNKINNFILKTPWLTADSLTAIRLISSLPLFIFVLKEWYLAAFFLFSIMSLTDVLDGYVARLKKTDREIGSVLDGVTDMIFFLPSFWILGFKFLNPITVILLFSLEILRGVLALLARVLKFKVTLSANIAGKIKACFEGLGLAILLLSPIQFLSLSNILFIIAILFAMTNLILHLNKFLESITSS